MRVAIWSLRLRPARSRPPSSAPTASIRAALEGAVHVFVVVARRRGRPPATRRVDRVESGVHRRSLVGVEVAGGRQRLGVRVRAGEVVERQLPVEVGRAAQRGEFGRRPVGEPAAPEAVSLVSIRSPLSTSSMPTRIPLRADLRRQRPELDEALRQGLVEGVARVVGREREVVQALGALAPGDGRAAALQRQPDVARHVLLGVVDEGVEAALEARVPEPVVDQPGPLVLDAPLVAARRRARA